MIGGRRRYSEDELRYFEVREKEDAVSQFELAARTEMDANPTSAVVSKLVKKGLVSFDLDAWGVAYRLLLSDTGGAALGTGRQVVLRAAEGLRQDRMAEHARDG